VNDIDKIKKVSDIKNIFYGDYINGRHIPTHKRLYIIDEFDKILDTISEKPAISNAAAAMNAMSTNLLNGIMGLSMSNDISSGVIVMDSDTSSCENGNGESNNENGKIKTTGKDDEGFMKGKKRSASSSLTQQKSVINDADILTIMDGLVETSGRIIICTANDPSKISEPFKRPGRLDEHIEFTKCTRKMIIQLLELFYSTILSVEQKEKINNMENNLHLKYSPAEINKFCFNNINNMDDLISDILE
jgi:SpoVK/Ycf46/Vps4 family AAA+-type ATPase